MGRRHDICLMILGASGCIRRCCGKWENNARITTLRCALKDLFPCEQMKFFFMARSRRRFHLVAIVASAFRMLLTISWPSRATILTLWSRRTLMGHKVRRQQFILLAECSRRNRQIVKFALVYLLCVWGK